MDALEAIKSRRSIRKYRGDPIPEGLIFEILEAGRWAPSASNSQPWHFILLRDDRVKRDIAEATTYGKFLAEAPIGIAVVIDPEASTHPVEDGAIATQNMLLAAHALGLGGCWIGSYGSVYEERAKEILNIPKEKRLISIISIGFPAESCLKSSLQKTRRELRTILSIDKYGMV
ncbi:MAG: nitroreductase family protein [Nitrososphaerales archaeon]